MLSKEESKELRVEFWTSLQEKMDKMRNPHGTKVDWMNYNTGVKHLYFRMEADEKGCRLCIDLQFPDKGIRELYYEQFTELSNLLNAKIKKLEWLPEHHHWNGKDISRIVVEKTDCQLFERGDWNKMHLFLKGNFAKLDEFWSEMGDVIKNLK
jgi:hypothetical protein